MRKTGVTQQCLQCGIDMYVPAWLSKQGGGKYCSRNCHNMSLIGKEPGNKAVSNSICKGCSKVFHIAPSKLLDNNIKRGVFCSKECRDKNKVGKPPWNIDVKGEEYKKHYTDGFGGIFQSSNGKFKGNKKDYLTIHAWVRAMLGTPNVCSSCSGNFTKKNIHWANVSGEYKYDTKDWVRLCVKCHYIFDNVEARRKI